MTSQLISPVSRESTVALRTAEMSDAGSDIASSPTRESAALISSSSVEPSSPDQSHRASANDDRHLKSYQTNQQVKYLHLQAEIEVLLQQLQTLKQQKVKTPALKAEEN